MSIIEKEGNFIMVELGGLGYEDEEKYVAYKKLQKELANFLKSRKRGYIGALKSATVALCHRPDEIHFFIKNEKTVYPL
ncbi:MAG: hypothetical protein AAB698_00730 [Patescibacteria group bacterium]